MGSDYKPLQDYLKIAYSHLGVSDAVSGVEVITAYRDIVGELINKLSRSPRYEKGVLYVSIESAALRQELSYKRQSLAAKINEKIGRAAVRDIVFR